jgi:hypothetical protein
MDQAPAVRHISAAARSGVQYGPVVDVSSTAVWWQAPGVVRLRPQEPSRLVLSLSMLRQCQTFVEIVDRLVVVITQQLHIPSSTPDSISVVDMGCGRGYF